MMLVRDYDGLDDLIKEIKIYDQSLKDCKPGERKRYQEGLIASLKALRIYLQERYSREHPKRNVEVITYDMALFFYERYVEKKQYKVAFELVLNHFLGEMK